jgi:hypothetical protein
MSKAQSTIAVALTLISLHPDDIGSQPCPTCSNLMDLHQPDSGFPERMLWTCDHCATWFLMDIIPEKLEAVLVCLPDHGHFRTALLDVDRGDSAQPPTPGPDATD